MSEPRLHRRLLTNTVFFSCLGVTYVISRPGLWMVLSEPWTLLLVSMKGFKETPRPQPILKTWVPYHLGYVELKTDEAYRAL